MTLKQKTDYKKQLLRISLDILEKRIASNQLAIDNAQASANEEEKSSAGDKYETSRAMSHIEKDMYAKQLAANKNEIAALLSVDCTKLYSSIVPGAVIKCSGCTFFIAAGLGKITVEGEIVYLLSPNVPLAKLLYNKSKGDGIFFNDKELLILDVY